MNVLTTYKLLRKKVLIDFVLENQQIFVSSTDMMVVRNFLMNESEDQCRWHGLMREQNTHYDQQLRRTVRVHNPKADFADLLREDRMLTFGLNSLDFYSKQHSSLIFSMIKMNRSLSCLMSLDLIEALGEKRKDPLASFQFDSLPLSPVLFSQDDLAVVALEQRSFSCEDYLLKFALVDRKKPKDLDFKYLSLEHFSGDSELIRLIQSCGMETPSIKHLKDFVFLVLGQDYLATVDLS